MKNFAFAMLGLLALLLAACAPGSPGNTSANAEVNIYLGSTGEVVRLDTTSGEGAWVAPAPEMATAIPEGSAAPETGSAVLRCVNNATEYCGGQYLAAGSTVPKGSIVRENTTYRVWYCLKESGCVLPAARHVWVYQWMTNTNGTWTATGEAVTKESLDAQLPHMQGVTYQGDL